MAPKDIELIQNNWAKVEPLATDVARLFYGKLFELDPALKPLFKGDMVEQGVKLTSLLGTVVRGLNNLDAKAAWTEAYVTLSTVMKQAAYGEVQELKAK